MDTGREIDWTAELAQQLDWHWQHQVRPRLAGLTDAEYFWEPVAGCWNLRPRSAGTPPEAAGGGDFVIDFAVPEPVPPPVTTIAWRIGHLLVGVLGARNASHFGGPPIDYQSYDYPGTAALALERLDQAYAGWIGGVRGLDDAGLARPCGEYGFEQDPMAGLVLHINRETIHHCAEIALLRDLYAHRQPPLDPRPPG
ncbi:hypothetical protein JOE57_003039 [Microlunatus panaciterrae]|uniref:DinB-like domain-containing protein n=1 Tax=Microlunatus panaciterrae TaxID=400768 RepID=A0ABS2RN87_9ACTN|nr:DinB family protein [Microlunatus panaciterrae]MBM7800118.1 hypothetical protein [Microlunatus panaciterrae]